MVESRNCVQREGVFRWFSSLTSAQRAEFLCGLLDLCVPVELRFLGSCLEDLARKDYHSLRDAEIKANNPADLSGLTNITDEVVRSKLLVSLALLGSDNREAARVLYRTLTHIDTVINNYGLALNDGRTGEEFLLLFTMASNHPAFSFHQKQVLRQQLGQIQDILQVSSGEAGSDSQAAGPGGDHTAVGCAQPNQYSHHYSTSLPLGSVPTAACSMPNASCAYLPLSACHPCHTDCTCWHKNQTREASTVSGLGSGVTVGRGDQAVNQELTPLHSDLHPLPPPPSPPPPPTPPSSSHLPPSLPAGQSQDAPASTINHQGKVGKVVIEQVVLRGVTHTTEDTSEYVFEVSWSDGFVLSVVRTQQEVMELLSQLSKAFPEEGVEKIELNPRCLTALPCHILQHHSIQLFFTSTRPLSPIFSSSLPPIPSSPLTAPVPPNCPFTSSPNLGCMVQHRGSNRAVYRVASVQPVISTHCSVLTRSAPHLSSFPHPLPPSLPLPQFPPQISSLPQGGGGGDPSSQSHPQHGQSHMYSQLQQHSQHLLHQSSTQSLHLSHSQPTSHSHSQPCSQSHTQPPPQSQPNPEQNGILDWLRRLRLHKYYPVFKQLTMEEFLALTEEDLNKYDLTQGAKKKLKTQLELQKSADREMKMEKRSCSGIARVTPSSYVGPLTHPTSTADNKAAELRVEVDTVPHRHPVSTDSSSSSGYSSSSCSPRTPLCCDSTFDRSRDIHRPGPEKDRSCIFIMNSHYPTGSSRPTAQVMPVQTDPLPPPLPPSCSSRLPFSLPQSSYHPQASYPQTLLPPVSNPARILTSPRKPRPPPLCTDDRTKPLCSGMPAAGTGFSLGLSMRLENLFPSLNVDASSALQDSVVCHGMAGGTVGLMVETSSALTSTSNSLHHVSHPPLHFHLSSSSSPSPSGYYSCPPTSSSSSFSSSCTSSKSGSQSGSSVPVAAVPAVHGNTYYPPQTTSSHSPSPTSASTVEQSSGHTSSMCVCSSCGCRGNCGAYGALPAYATAGYLQPFSAGPSLFTLGPLLHLSPLIASSSASGTGAPPFSYPMMVPPPLYRHSPVSQDLQQGFGFYQTQSLMGNGGQKQGAGNLSCYNCGANGHRAEDCKQAPMDSTQQGTFCLKYTPRSDSKDSAD